MRVRRLYSSEINKETGVLCDQTVVFVDRNSLKNYPEKLRRIKYIDADNQKCFVFLTNNFALDAVTICKLYQCRWQIELFFRWIKQHLRIKAFFGTSLNAVKTQIWIAISIYVLVAIIKKRLNIEHELYIILQILSIALFEKIDIYQLLTELDYTSETCPLCKQLDLFAI